MSIEIREHILSGNIFWYNYEEMERQAWCIFALEYFKATTKNFQKIQRNYILPMHLNLGIAKFNIYITLNNGKAYFLLWKGVFHMLKVNPLFIIHSLNSIQSDTNRHVSRKNKYNISKYISFVKLKNTRKVHGFNLSLPYFYGKWRFQWYQFSWQRSNF